MDIIVNNIIAILLSLIFGYFFGSIPVGVILCRLIKGKDPRDFGSKNSGGTNVGRIFGIKLGAVTILLDVLKTVLPMFLVYFLLQTTKNTNFMVKNFGENFNGCFYLIIFFAPLGATIGHCWPIFADFHGGKAVASITGFAFFSSPIVFLIGFVLFGATLKRHKIVSLASMISTFCLSLILWIFFIIGKITSFDTSILMWGFGLFESWASLTLSYCIIFTVMTGILIFRHRNNIKKLINGCENKIHWMK